MKKRAFTLIELLVVIAIIAILAAILFPVFAQAKAAAKKTASLSNVKNLGLATQMYASDADDVLPLSRVYGTDSSGAYQVVFWPTLIYPYVKNGAKEDGTASNFANNKGDVQGGGIFQSPGDSRDKQINGSYVVHNRLFASPPDGRPARSATSVDDLANKIQLFERGDSDGQAGWDNFYPDQWFWTTGSMAPDAGGNPTKAPDSRLDLTKNVGDCDNSITSATANGFSWQNCSMYPRYRFNRATLASYVDGHASALVRTDSGSKLDWYKNIYIQGISDPLY